MLKLRKSIQLVLFFSVFLICGCSSYSAYIYKPKFQAKAGEGKIAIRTYCETGDKKVTYLSNYYGNIHAELRYASKMLTTNEVLTGILGKLILIDFIYPKTRTEDSGDILNPAEEIRKLSDLLGAGFEFVDETGKYKNAKMFLKSAKRDKDGYALVMRILNIADVPVKYDQKSDRYYNTYYQYKLPAATSMMKLYHGGKKILDYRENLVSQRLMKTGSDTGLFEDKTMLHKRRTETISKQIMDIFYK